MGFDYKFKKRRKRIERDKMLQEQERIADMILAIKKGVKEVRGNYPALKRP